MEGCMSEMKQVRSLIKQADACCAQGLFAESRGKYEEILSFLESNRNLQNREKFTEAVGERLRDVNADLKSVRDILVSSLRKKGMSDLVPALSGEILTSVKAPDDFLAISSIKIHFYDGKRHRYTVDLDVVYQIGGLASLGVSSADRALLDSLKLGKTLRDIRFDTPVTVFRGAGIITRKSLIEKGSGKGNDLRYILLAEER
jgi:hypothetical protein